jgi:hypothetical protein
MILGSLQQAADSMGEAGLRVHRAHWVARRAIVKIVKNGHQWYCLLSNDLKIPISRRNKSTVAGWFGHTTRISPSQEEQYGRELSIPRQAIASGGHELRGFSRH